MKFDSATVLITGSSDNIGRAIALKFASEGANIIVNAKSNITGGKQVAEEIKAMGRQVIFIQADVSEPEQVEHLFNQSIKTFGKIDILINNAGSVIQMPVLESNKDHWMQVFNNNLFGSVLCSITAAKHMRKNGSGKIINTASIRGIEHAGRTGIMAYSAAKAALINFTKTLAKELAPQILVNAVAPGFTLTNAFDSVPESTKKQWINETFIKRWLNVDEVADAFVYLAGANGITGEVLVIDGGWTLK
jgi:3-oxoacyl-[acyl-carrier protein] reductase